MRTNVYQHYRESDEPGKLACKRCGTKIKKRPDKSTGPFLNHKKLCERKIEGNGEPSCKKQRLLEDFTLKPDDSTSLNEPIVKFFAEFGIPFEAVESPTFTDMMRLGGHQFSGSSSTSLVDEACLVRDGRFQFDQWDMMRLGGHQFHRMALKPTSSEIVKAAQEFVQYLNKAVTPFHAVQEMKDRLLQAGFQELPEADSWDIKPKNKYFVTKNRSAIMAFAVGGKYKPGNGFSIVVGHTDSPCLRVKPISRQKGEKFLQVGVSTYGGGIWRTWFDRDLSVAGMVVVRNEQDELVRKLIDVKKPVLFIPNLAIHLETDRATFKPNTETEIRPILMSFAAAELNGQNDCQNKDFTNDPRSITANHHSQFLELIAHEANCKPEEIVDLDLYLYDVNQAAVIGSKDEFIAGARLDNQVGTYTSIMGLLESLETNNWENDEQIRMAACFDNEEVGSNSAQGAASSLTEQVMRRLAVGGSQTAFEEAVPKSMLISADQAHAAHPNYPAKHEENHRPTFHGGIVVKVNVNQRYATTSTTHSVLKQIAYEAQVPLQVVVVRNDSPCGSTVGPILATRLGLETVDVGGAQLGMHSIREFADTSGIYHATKLYSKFFDRLPHVLANVQ